MTSPLEIMIALHYWTAPTEYDGGTGGHYESAGTQRIIAEFVERGFLRQLENPNEYGGKYRATDALSVWVGAICAVPFPVQQWTIPDRAP